MPAPNADHLLNTRAQLDDALSKIESIDASLLWQHTRILLRCVAVRLNEADAEAATFTIARNREFPVLWELESLHDADDEELPIADTLEAEINGLLQSRGFEPNPDAMPASARTPIGQARWTLPVQETWQADVVPPSIIDITRLTEEDYTRIHHAARQQLGLVGTVRTRTDVHEYLDEDPRIRTDLTDAQREVATEVILHRYQQFQDDPDHGADNDAAVFARIVDEVTDFLDLTDDQPGWVPTPTVHRPSRSSRAD